MNRKTLLLSVLAVATVTVLAVALSAVAVFALTADNPTQVEEVQVVDEVIEVAPVQAEVPSQMEVADPVLTRKVSYGHEDGGCPFSKAAKAQLAETPNETVETEPLVQVDP